MNNNKLTDEEITELVLKLFDGSSFYFQSGRRPGAKTMAELLNKAACAVAELQERRQFDLREKVRADHAAWADKTFGSIGPVGPLKHLSKEALEAAAAPGDLSEWADMQFLLWDAQRRAGISDEQITQAMIEKLAINKVRQWPEPKDGEPRLHIKEQSEQEKK